MSEIKKNVVVLVVKHKLTGNINPKVIEKLILERKKRIKIIKSNVDICGKNKSQIFTIGK